MSNLPNISTLEQIAPSLGRFSRVMGLDLGTKTIGLGLSDVERTLASPLETIQRTKFGADAKRLVELADRHEVAAFVGPFARADVTAMIVVGRCGAV